MLTSLLDLYITNQIANFYNSQPIPWDATSVLTANAIPMHDGIHISPVINAKSALIVDLDSGTSLYSKNSFERMPIASITKLMTAIIILEENDPEEIVAVSTNAAQTSGSKIWLYPGEEIRVNQLLYATLIHSGNDAAVALAEHNAESVSAFVEKMNKKAKSLGLHNTNFTNPTGLDQEDNYSTAQDLSILARYAFKKSFIRQAATVKEMTISSVNGKLTHELKATNDLLKSDAFNFKGLKTGHTDKAGLCLVSVAENENRNRIMTIILNSPDRFQETKVLADWAFRAYKW